MQCIRGIALNYEQAQDQLKLTWGASKQFTLGESVLQDHIRQLAVHYQNPAVQYIEVEIIIIEPNLIYSCF